MIDAVDVTAFDAAWRTRWPQTRPIGHELRSSAHTTWVRFHSLPGSKRYAESDAEYDELLMRHSVLLAELSSSTATPTDDLRVVTAAWSDSPESAELTPDLAALFPHSRHWMPVPYDLSEPDDPVWTHLYLDVTAIDADPLRRLLKLVADDVTGAVIICPPGLDWMYAPYDGGGDVIAPNRAVAEMLRHRHPDWLSTHPQGL